MLEPAINGPWTSVHGMNGAHYNTYACVGNGMDALRLLFPDGQANALNFCLFSTSGIHGSYRTIEDCEQTIANGFVNGDGDPDPAPNVTFLVVQPRICCLRYGNCSPRSVLDFNFLRKLRESSWAVVQGIGK